MKQRVFGFALTLMLPIVANGADKGFFIGGGFGYGDVDGVADTSSGVQLGFPPGTMTPAILSAGLDGVQFDGSDWSRRIFAGYRINETWSLQLGASDLGTYPSVPTLASPSNDVSLEIYEYSLVAKVQIPVGGRFSASWRLGLTYNNFDAGGQAVRLVFIPPAIFTLAAPYSDPDNEFGYAWGFGAGWNINSKIDLDLNYVRHESQVISVDTVNLDLIYSF